MPATIFPAMNCNKTATLRDWRAGDAESRRICGNTGDEARHIVRYPKGRCPNVVMPGRIPLIVPVGIPSRPEAEDLSFLPKESWLIRHLKPQNHLIFCLIANRVKTQRKTMRLKGFNLPDDGRVNDCPPVSSSRLLWATVHPSCSVGDVADRKGTLVLEDEHRSERLLRIKRCRWGNGNFRTI